MVQHRPYTGRKRGADQTRGSARPPMRKRRKFLRVPTSLSDFVGFIRWSARTGRKIDQRLVAEFIAIRKRWERRSPQNIDQKFIDEFTSFYQRWQRRKARKID